jgi:hypothetical protein
LVETLLKSMGYENYFISPWLNLMALGQALPPTTLQSVLGDVMACRKLIGYRLTNSPDLVKVTFLAIGSRLSADKNLLPARVLMTIEWKDHYKNW